jgi:hypothetical protein
MEIAVTPAYLYALLRIVFGLLGCVFLFGLSDLGMFWDPGGLVPLAESTWKQLVIGHGWGTVAGRSLYVVNLGAAMLMTIGYRSSVMVPVSFIASMLQSWWNPLPLAASFEIRSAVLFCLMWANAGQVWSVDAWLARRGASTNADERQAGPVSRWPLRLIRFQIALIYFSTGLWKLGGDQWRDGSALHYVLSNNGFARFPVSPPAEVASLLVIGTYIVLLWELTFPFLVAFRRTRWIPLLTGVILHLGMWITIELGPFSWVMLASYVAFAEPERVVAIVSALQLRWRSAVRRDDRAWRDARVQVERTGT